jgi:hypothetical protein
MAKKQTRPPSPEAEEERGLRNALLCRELRVIARGGRDGDVVEIAPRPGYRITFMDELDGDRRRVRILVGPIPAGPPKRD